MFKIKLLKIIFTFALILSLRLQSTEVGKSFDKRLFSDDIKIVQEAIAEGADLNAKNEFGLTALMQASIIKNKEIAKLLINMKADLNVKNNYGNTALNVASMDNERLEITKLLIEAGADLNSINNYGNTALMESITFNNDPETTQLLINAGADLNIQNNKGQTALMIAANRHREEIIKLIKDRMEYLEKAKKEVKSCLSDPNTQILPSVVSGLINEYL